MRPSGSSQLLGAKAKACCLVLSSTTLNLHDTLVYISRAVTARNVFMKAEILFPKAGDVKNDS